MEEDKLVQKLAPYKHSEIIEAMQCISKSKLKTGKDRFVLFQKAKEKLYPYSGDQNILLVINAIDKITS